MALVKSSNFKTTCSYCGVGCGIEVKKDAYGKLEIEGEKDYPVNKGMLCSKGRTIYYTVQDKSDRLLAPMMRWHRKAPLEEISWSNALDRAAAVFKSIIAKYGPDSVGFYVSGQCLTEEYYLANKIVKGFIGTNNIDTNSRLCMSSAVVGYKMSIGEDSVPVSYADIELADTFFVTGANPAWCHPIIWRRVEQHKEANPGVKIICVDPRRTNTAMSSDLHLQLIPGTDVYLHKAIARILIEKDWVDNDFIQKHVDGYADFKTSVFEFDLAYYSEKCGVELVKLELAAQYIGASKGFISMWTMGLNQSSIAVNKNLSLIALSLITGQIGKPGAGPFSLTGQPNAMGGREVGGLSNMLAAHRSLENPAHIKEVAEYWGVHTLSNKPGLTATQMFEAMKSGKLKAIWIICTNPLVSLPDARYMEEALSECKFVVVQDISANSDTVKYADLVLPAAGFMEKEGTMTNSERRVSIVEKVLDPPGKAKPDSQILIDFAHKMGWGESFKYDTLEDVYKEHAALTKGTNIDVSGLNYDIIRSKRSVQWPYKTGATRGTTRLFTDFKFYTDNGNAKLYAVSSKNESEALSSEFPLVLTTGRVRDQWHTGTRTGKVNKLKQHLGKPFLEIHPEDAKARGIVQDDVVVVQGRRGEVQVPAYITEDIKQGVVFLPMHYGKMLGKDLVRTNNLTNNLLDPKSKQPDLKYSTVEVVKFKKPKEKIVLIGAGAAAFKFVTEYPKLNPEDEIVVFSRESTPFYNRVLLPDYISGEKEWDVLRKDKEEKFSPNLRVICNKVEKIDRDNKLVIDRMGNQEKYDKLILCTGSRAFKPNVVAENFEGVYTLRTKQDADTIKEIALGKGKAVIVGAGLLGIELADSLRKIGVNVNVIQRSSRLMERQLDDPASELLSMELRDRGINIIYNDEVKEYIGDGKLEAIRLKSGRTLMCELAVFAIGTRPRIELAKNSGIKCGRGVIVNEYMQTSDANVFAMGEIAEYKRNLFGITAAAEEQAELLVRYLSGDTSNQYEGSLLMNILKVEGVDLCSIGEIHVPKDNHEYEEIIFSDLRNRKYKRCVVYKDRLIGAIMVGDKGDFLDFKDLIKNKIELGDRRMELLQGKSERKEIIGRLVCSCNAVGEGNLIAEIKNGCEDFKQLCAKTGAGSGCGSCRPEVKDILESQLAAV
jgi:ferredoxin-nitrate reductase